MSQSDVVELKKEIGIFHGVSIIIGVIVGSGIFVSPVGVLEKSGSVGMSFVMWIITGIFSILGAIVYAELGVTIPKSGGEYIYILTAFGGLPAFICLWITFFVIGAASTAANSIIFAKYVITPFFPSCHVPEIATLFIGISGIAFLSFVNSFNVKWATKTAIIFTICKVSALIVIIIFGFYYLISKGGIESFEQPFLESKLSPGSLAQSFFQGFWAFAGWNYLNFLTSEMKNPARNLPIAIALSLLIVTIIYIAANVAYLAVLMPNELLASKAVAFSFANRAMGSFSFLMPVFVGASVFGSMNGEILSMSRLPFSGAREGHMPSLLSMVSVKFLTPLPSVILMLICAVLFTLYSELDYLIELTGLAFSVISTMAVCCLLFLRYKRPYLPRPFKLPVVVPILFLGANLLVIVITIVNSPLKDTVLTLCLMLSAVPVYLVGVTWDPKPKAFQDKIDGLTRAAQKLLNVVPEGNSEEGNWAVGNEKEVCL